MKCINVCRNKTSNINRAEKSIFDIVSNKHFLDLTEDEYESMQKISENRRNSVKPIAST
jgi:hypothetical protein